MIKQVLRLPFLVLALVGFSTSAFAADALFDGRVNRFHYLYYTTFAPQQTGVGAVTGSGPASFTIPNRALSGGTFSYSAAFPGYPYFAGSRTRYMTQGNFGPNFMVPNSVFTQGMQTGANVPYPNALPTSPVTATIMIAAGPNGFGGFMGVHDYAANGLRGTVASFGGGGGYSDFYFKPMPYGAVPGVPKGLDHDGGANNWTTLPSTSVPVTLCCHISKINNQTNPSQEVGLQAPHQGIGHFTGMFTLNAPGGFYATTLTYAGADNRSAGGLSGNIVMVAPTIISTFVLPNFPTNDGLSEVQGLANTAAGAVRIDLTFLPEPTQWGLLGAGILGLAVLARRTGFPRR